MNPQRIAQNTSDALHRGKTCLQAVLPELPVQQSLFAAMANVPSDVRDKAAIRLVMRSTDALKSHSSLLKQNLWPTNERLLALEKLGESIFEQPLLITQENLIVDGYARWRIARRQQRGSMLCQVCQLTGQEALERILQTHRHPEWLNAFSRVRLALDLEPWLHEKARTNQSNGGREKGSSKLTEDRRLDCRKQIADLAGVSTGNVTKVKQILRSERTPKLIDALRSGEISIHRAWMLSRLSIAEQENSLGSRIIKKRANERLRRLLAKHVPISDSETDSLRLFSQCLKRLKSTPWMASHWKQIDELLAAIECEVSIERSRADVHQTDHQEDTRRQSDSLGQYADHTIGTRELPESA